MDAVNSLVGDTSLVAPKFRRGARGLVAIFLTCTFLRLIKGINDIFKNRHNPPTTIAFADAQNRDVDWGPMPWIAVKLESHGEAFGPHFTKSKTTVANADLGPNLWKKFAPADCSGHHEPQCPRPLDSYRPTLSVVTTNTNKASQNNLAILDMTQIQPQWSSGTPAVEIILHSNSTKPFFTFYTGDAKQLKDAREIQDFGVKFRGPFKGHAVGKLSEKPPGCLRMYIEVEKGIVPKNSTCWGLPWHKHYQPLQNGFPWWSQDACTEDHFTMVFSALSDEESVSDDCESGQIKIQILVRSFMVRSVVPQSICAQLHSEFTQSLGGTLALMTSVFLFLFVRQYPSTHNEMMNTALTLRGTEYGDDVERPTFEEYKKMEEAESDAEE